MMILFVVCRARVCTVSTCESVVFFGWFANFRTESGILQFFPPPIGKKTVSSKRERNKRLRVCVSGCLGLCSKRHFMQISLRRSFQKIAARDHSRKIRFRQLQTDENGEQSAVTLINFSRPKRRGVLSCMCLFRREPKRAWGMVYLILFLCPFQDHAVPTAL